MRYSLTADQKLGSFRITFDLKAVVFGSVSAGTGKFVFVLLFQRRDGDVNDRRRMLDFRINNRLSLIGKGRIHEFRNLITTAMSPAWTVDRNLLFPCMQSWGNFTVASVSEYTSGRRIGIEPEKGQGAEEGVDDCLENQTGRGWLTSASP